MGESRSRNVVRRAARSITVAACAVLTGCTHLVAGSASYAPDSAAKAYALVKTDQLAALVLQPPEIDGVMHAEYDVEHVYIAIDAAPGIKAIDRKCVGALLAGAEPAYRGSNYGAVRGMGLRGPDDRVVDEAVVAFPDAAAAAEFVRTQAASWKDCVGTVLTMGPPEYPETHWVAQPPATSYGVAVLFRTQEGHPDFGCTHGLVARSNVVADVLACSHESAELNDQVAAIANKMLGTIIR